MSTTTSIEWTRGDDGAVGATWNPVTGCKEVSPGCDNCYARVFAERWRGIPGHPFEQGFDVRLWPDRLGLPLRWRKPRRIFVNSMSDLSGLVTILFGPFPLVRAYVPSAFCVQRVSGTEITASDRGQNGRRAYSAAGKRIPESRSMVCRKWELDVVALFRVSAVRSEARLSMNSPPAARVTVGTPETSPGSPSMVVPARTRGWSEPRRPCPEA
jgi:hypothetical protein